MLTSLRTCNADSKEQHLRSIYSEKSASHKLLLPNISTASHPSFNCGAASHAQSRQSTSCLRCSWWSTISENDFHRRLWQFSPPLHPLCHLDSQPPKPILQCLLLDYSGVIWSGVLAQKDARLRNDWSNAASLPLLHLLQVDRSIGFVRHKAIV